MNQYPTVTRESKAFEQSLIARTKMGDSNARDLVLWSLTRLLKPIVMRLAHNNYVPGFVNDLIQDTWEDVSRSLGYFEIGHEAWFSTYLLQYIRGAIFVKILRYRSILSIGRGAASRYAKLKCIQREHWEKHKLDPSWEELSILSGISLATVRRMFMAQKAWVSFDDQEQNWKLSSERVRSYLPWQRIKATKDPYELLDNSFKRNAIEELLLDALDSKVISRKELYVILKRHNDLFGEKPWHFTRIGKSLGVSRERARQLYHRVMRRLSHWYMTKRLLENYWSQ